RLAQPPLAEPVAVEGRRVEVAEAAVVGAVDGAPGGAGGHRVEEVAERRPAESHRGHLDRRPPEPPPRAGLHGHPPNTTPLVPRMWPSARVPPVATIANAARARS